MKKRTFVTAAVLAAFMALGQAALFAQTRLEPYLELELKRLEETYRLMDKYARTIWPGWDNYMEIEFRVQYPNLVFLLIGPREKVPEGYELVQGRTFRGKQIYLNRKEELPVKIQPPLTGGGGGGLTIRIHLQENNITQEEAAKALAEGIKEKGSFYQPPGSSDREIILYVHEFFHGYQRRIQTNLSEMREKKEKTGKEQAEKPKPEMVKKREIIEDRDREGRDFESNTGYSTYSSIEGQALLNAYLEKNKKKALEYLKDYSVAREIKHSQFMPADAAAGEAHGTVMEGTAVYANTRMLMLIKDKKYKPAMTQKDDPFFYGFRFADGKIAEDMSENMRDRKDDTLDTSGKFYTFGVYQCFLLDRFFPKWKKGFFENGLTLDQVLASGLKLSDKEKAAIAERLKTKYEFDKIQAKHAALIADRDEIRGIVKGRKGLTYIVDFQKTREFLEPVPRKGGRDITVMVSGYFINGIEEYTMGDIVMTTWNTPIHKPFLYTLEWTDTEAKPDVKGYTFHYEKQEGDVYKNIVFTTPGFTLKAPEVQIKEIKEKNQFRIIILSKVAR